MLKRTVTGVTMVVMVLGGLLAGGCAQRRAVDYEIQVAKTFDYKHRKETEPFYSGEKFRLRVTTHEDCYAYIFNKGTSGQYNVLFPHPRINGGSNFVTSWQKIKIPPPDEKQGAYMFAAEPGVETLIICVSGKRVAKLERIVHGQETDPRIIAQILQRLEADGKHRGNFQKIHHRGHTQVILESPHKDAVMVNVIRLEHAPRGQ